MFFIIFSLVALAIFGVIGVVVAIGKKADYVAEKKEVERKEELKANLGSVYEVTFKTEDNFNFYDLTLSLASGDIQLLSLMQEKDDTVTILRLQGLSTNIISALNDLHLTNYDIEEYDDTTVYEDTTKVTVSMRMAGVTSADIMSAMNYLGIKLSKVKVNKNSVGVSFVTTLEEYRAFLTQLSMHNKDLTVVNFCLKEFTES